jgi:hypothetical protein
LFDTLSLHDALPISYSHVTAIANDPAVINPWRKIGRPLRLRPCKPA